MSKPTTKHSAATAVASVQRSAVYVATNAGDENSNTSVTDDTSNEVEVVPVHHVLVGRDSL